MSKQNQGARTRSGTELRDSRQRESLSNQSDDAVEPRAKTTAEEQVVQSESPDAQKHVKRPGAGGANPRGGEGGRSHRLSAEGFGLQRGAEAQGSFPRDAGEEPDVEDEADLDADDEDVELADEVDDDEEVDGTRADGRVDRMPGQAGQMQRGSGKSLGGGASGAQGGQRSHGGRSSTGQ